MERGVFSWVLSLDKQRKNKGIRSKKTKILNQNKTSKDSISSEVLFLKVKSIKLLIQIKGSYKGFHENLFIPLSALELILDLQDLIKLPQKKLLPEPI